MRRVLAIGWEPTQLISVISACETEWIRLVHHDRTSVLTPDLGGHFDLILVNGIASLDAYQKLKSILDSDTSTTYVFEPEDTPLHVLKRYRKEDFLWSTGNIGIGTIRQCLQNRDMIEWKRRNDEIAFFNFKSFLKLFHKTVTHEFQTPVNIIKTSTHLLENYIEKLSHEDRQEQIGFLKEGSERLEKLIRDIRMYSEFTNKGTEKLLCPVSISEMLESSVQHLTDCQPEAEERLTYSPNLNGQFITLDSRLLNEALKRIVQNALENSTGPVNIQAGPQGDHVAITITDSGQGIPESDLDDIFLPYSRGGEVDSKQGLGLGLPIAKHCIEAQGGTLSVESHQDIGSTFTIRLPIEHPQEEPLITDD